MKALLLLTLAMGSLQANDWSHFLGPNRDGTSKETGLLKSFPKAGPEILWEIELEEGLRLRALGAIERMFEMA